MNKTSVGKAVVESLRSEGVKHVFYTAGSCILPILDALYDAEDIRGIAAKHEQSAAHMADAYARTTGTPGVCLVHNGPGLTNTISGVATAYRAHSPLIILSGAPATSHIYLDSVQEVDQQSLLRPVVKWNAQVNRAERILELMEYAFRVATTGRMGPVHLDIPRDLQYKVIDMDPLPTKNHRQGERVRGDPDLIKAAAERLIQAERPLIIAGGGVVWSDATQPLIELAEVLTIPVATSYGHVDAFPSNHPLAVGQLGRAGSGAARRLALEADLILALGTRLGHFTTYFRYDYISSEAAVVHVDIDAEAVGRYYPVAVGIVGDAREVVGELLDALKTHLHDMNPRNPGRLVEITAIKESWREETVLKTDSASFPIKPQRVFKELREIADDNAIFALDAGSACAYGYHLLECHEPRTFLSPLEFACMGWGYPAAIGAQAAKPDRQVFAICGDGAFTMSMQEIGVAVQYDLPVVGVVLNNHCLGAEKAYQKHFFDERYYGVELDSPDFAKIADAFGAKGLSVERPSEIKPALREALNSGVPSIIDVSIDPEELTPPARTDVVKRRMK